MDVPDPDRTGIDLSFEVSPDGRSIEVVDPIERHRYRLDHDIAVNPEPVDPDRFVFPVDTGVLVQTSGFVLPDMVTVYVRSETGEPLEELDHQSHLDLPPDRYVLDICSPIKLYVELEAGLRVRTGRDEMSIDFDRTAELHIGARSAHERPRATVTTTTDPEDMMRAIETFGSALKTTSPEQSFPNLRGHPPRVELGDALDIPSDIESPETGVTIELVPTLRSVYTTSSLVYYLGADVEPGRANRLHLDGTVVSLGSGSEMQTRTERLLKRALIMDCITRTEGFYQVDLTERRLLERRVDLDFDGLYDSPPGTRLRRYREVDYSDIVDLIGRWGAMASVAPDSTKVEVLPYLVDKLAAIRVYDPGNVDRLDAIAEANTGPQLVSATTRSDAPSTRSKGHLIQPEETEAQEHIWVGEGVPIGATKAVPEAFENRIDRTPTTDEITINVVCNEASMASETNLIKDLYGDRGVLPFDISIHQEQTVEEFRTILSERMDFLHYIGHIEDGGFSCSDGSFDATELREADIGAFLLNACDSYAQGRRLVEAGCIGGIVTLDEVIDQSALRMGYFLARLLNKGYPLYAALRIARERTLSGARYTIVGDGRVTLSQPVSGPQITRIESGPDNMTLETTTLPTSRIDLGSMVVTYLSSNDEYHLVSRTAEHANPSREDLFEFLGLQDIPVKLDGKFTWSSEIEDL